MLTVNVYGIRLIAKHPAGEPFRLSLHRLLSPSAVLHSLNVFDICVGRLLVLLAFISFVLAFPCLCISVYTCNKEANVNDPSHAVHYNQNMIHIYTMYNIEHNITKMCNQVAVI